MKATVDAKEFRSAVTWVSKVVSSKAVLPILAHVLISADEDKVTIRGTNLSQTLIREVNAGVTETGEATVPAKELKSYLAKVATHKNIPMQIESCAKLDEKPAWIALIIGEMRTTFSTGDPDDYPLATKDEGWDHAIPLDPKEAMLSEVAKFATTDSSRAVLGCILTEVYNGEANYRYRLTAADGFRLVNTSPVDGECVGSYLLPMQAAKIIATPGKGILKFKKDRWIAEFTASDSHIQSQLVEGRFPDYNQIIPSEDAGEWATFNTEQLSNALKPLAALTKHRYHSDVTRLNLLGNDALLSATSDDGTKTEVTIPVDWDSNDFLIGFDASYVLDCLALCGEETRIMFQEPYPDAVREDGTVSQVGHSKPLFVKGNGCVMVVMPMHIKG